MATWCRFCSTIVILLKYICIDPGFVTIPSAIRMYKLPEQVGNALPAGASRLTHAVPEAGRPDP